MAAPSEGVASTAASAAASTRPSEGAVAVRSEGARPGAATRAAGVRATTRGAGSTGSYPGARLVAASVLVPTKTYFAPSQPLTVRVVSAVPVDLLLVDFIGRSTSSRAGNVQPGEVDLHKLFPEPLDSAGTYKLLALPAGSDPARTDVSKFLGTPLVVSVREDARRSAPSGPMIIRVDPLAYAVIATSLGDMRVCFYYDTAPNTVATVQELMRDGFYDGLDFYRVEPGFIVQTGDPRSDGTGGPEFTVDGEFSDRQQLEGVLSLARMADPNEAPGLLPRPEFANSGGSQFFICLDYAMTAQLDRRYAAFGRVVDGLDVLRRIAHVPLRDGTSRPREPVRITSARLIAVTAGDNPYSHLRVVDTPNATTGPSGSTVTPATRPAR